MKKEMSMFVTEATMLPGGAFHGNRFYTENLSEEERQLINDGKIPIPTIHDSADRAHNDQGKCDAYLPGGGFHSIVCREAISGSAMNHFSYDKAAHYPTDAEPARNTDRKIPEELIPKIYGCGVKML